MPATRTARDRSARATERIRLRSDVFNQRTAELHATTEIARARLCEVDRTTLHRIRHGRIIPNLELAMRMARTLGLRVEELFERVPA